MVTSVVLQLLVVNSSTFIYNHARWEEKKVHVAMLIFNISLFVIGLAERAQPLNDRASRELGSSSIL